MKSSHFHNSKSRIRIPSEECAVEQPRQTLREVVDRMIDGKPISYTLRQHKPLPPDGEDENDFDTGTREINDLVDVFELSEEIAAAKQKAAKEDAEKSAEAQRSAFQKAVDEEIAKRAADSNA